MPERYRVRYARSAEEVLRELQKFVDYVKTGPVITLLPRTLHDLSAQDAGDVAKWQARIARTLLRTRPLGAIPRYWLYLLDEVDHALLSALPRSASSMTSIVRLYVPLSISPSDRGNPCVVQDPSVKMVAVWPNIRLVR